MGLRENIRKKMKVCSKEEIIKWARFWQLLITWFGKDKWWRSIVLYKCDCWKEGFTYTYYITHWKVSCWHDQYENNAKQAYKHWMWWTWKNNWQDRFYICYHNICSRTKRPKGKSKNYKWIKCERESFNDFKNDMYDEYLEHCKKYWEKDTTIERIDNKWNYCKENCRRATAYEQARNKSNIIIKNIDWKNLCLMDIYNKYNPNITYSSFLRRVKKWYDINTAILSKEEFINKKKL